MTSGATLRQLERDLGDLLERHDTGRDLRHFEQYRDRPVAFIREVLKGEPWERQVEIAEAVRDSPLVAVRSCNAAGKDWIAAHLALWWVYARRGLVLLTGPTERQVVEVCMSEVARAFRGASELPGELYRTTLRLPHEARAGVLAFTSTESSRLTGFHAPRVMAIVTEAQGVEEYAWEGLLACATGPQDRFLAVGNPLVPSGRFFAVSRGSGWRSIQASALDHPNLREGRTVIPGGPSQAFIDRMRAEYGEASPVYVARVLGEFPDQGEQGLFRRSWLEEAARRWKLWEGPRAGAEPVVAVDPARYGPDETVVAVRHGDVVSELVAWRRTDLMETVERVQAVLERVGVTAGDETSAQGVVVVDEVGLGAGVADRLRELGYNVSGFNGGRQARASGRFANSRAETYWKLRELLERGTVALPPDETLFDELVALQWRPTPEGRVRLEAKDDLHGRIGRSPDRADAVTMALSPLLHEALDVPLDAGFAAANAGFWRPNPWRER